MPDLWKKRRVVLVPVPVLVLGEGSYRISLVLGSFQIWSVARSRLIIYTDPIAPPLKNRRAAV